MQPDWVYGVLEYLDDQSVNEFFATVARDYKALTFVLSGPILYLIKKYTKWTPWPDDDKIAEKIEERLRLKSED